MGCLVHDAGMLQIDESLYNSREVLDDSQFLEITKHPVIAADMLCKKMTRIPLGVRMIVYQMHERCNGSGYPQGVSADRIHPLAKIAAVADTYVALVSPRPHRPAMLPYYAVKKILEGRQDGAVRRHGRPWVAAHRLAVSHRVLRRVGIRLVAKVMRSSGPAYDRPIVEAWRRPDLLSEPKIIDLTEGGNRIVKPLGVLR